MPVEIRMARSSPSVRLAEPSSLSFPPGCFHLTVKSSTPLVVFFAIVKYPILHSQSQVNINRYSIIVSALILLLDKTLAITYICLHRDTVLLRI